MSSSEATNSPQVNLLLSFFDAFRKIDLNLVGNHLHKDLRRLTYPKSLGRGEQTKEEYLQHAGKYMALWTECDPIVHSITEAEGTIVVHATNRAKTSLGVDMNREFIGIVRTGTDEDGNLKFKQIEEFTDSKAHLDFVKAVEVAKAKK